MSFAKKVVVLSLFILSAGIAAAAEPAPTGVRWAKLTYSQKVPGLAENPLKGFIPYARASSAAPYSMEWFYLPLSDVMKGKAVFDWGPLEKQLNAIAGRGHQAVFRFFVDYPNKASGIPKFLLDAGLKTFPYDDSNNKMSVSPDYSDPRLIKAFVDFIAAFGKKYDGDPRIGFLTAGLYGFWGEWHVHKHPTAGEPAGWKISQQDKDAILAAYVANFKKTIVQIRYGNITPDAELKVAFGYHDDSWAYSTLGADKNHFWTLIQDAGLEEIWRTKPVGGEMYPQLQQKIWDAWPNTTGQDVEECIKTTHATWMLDNALFAPAATDEERKNGLRAQLMMGYELTVPAVRLMRKGDGVTVGVEMENRGVAPFYYDWVVELAAVDGQKKIVASQVTPWRLHEVLPDKRQRWQIELPAVPSSAEKNIVAGGESVGQGQGFVLCEC